ncbi:hypothetical protein NDU88_007384 [Pleurodeles waltl]|uniref:Uncharacterized protein n=1 Tax=Pleurodeles waltl TaxID=8319 RepID=A0AAV7QNV1_PLEWA|nr:hypothetical protein NDU88_007384 [Pleurodeles waltl]
MLPAARFLQAVKLWSCSKHNLKAPWGRRDTSYRSTVRRGLKPILPASLLSPSSGGGDAGASQAIVEAVIVAVAAAGLPLAPIPHKLHLVGPLPQGSTGGAANHEAFMMRLSRHAPDVLAERAMFLVPEQRLSISRVCLERELQL